MYNVLSMFSGAGGLDMGFYNKGFRILWANDSNKDACQTYEKWINYDKNGRKKSNKSRTIICSEDISKVNFDEISPDYEIDVVIGGFPCQGFSMAGPRKIDDSRNALYKYFIKMVKNKQPKVFVAENVVGIRTLGGGIVFDKIIRDFSKLGYTLSATTVNSKFYGVPQDRLRVIFIGVRNDICNGGAFIFPRKYNYVVTLGETLSKLPKVNMDDVCQSSFSTRYMSRNRKREYNDVSYTIPAMAKQVPLSPDSGGMVYKDVDKFVFVGTNRRLSYKEAAAIQTFPEDMVFYGSLTSKYRQIGNAVPVKLAEVIADQILKILKTKDNKKYFNYENPTEEIYAVRK